MTDRFVTEETVGEDGKLVLQLPPDAPRGHIRITVEAMPSENNVQLSPEEEAALDAEIQELLSDENLGGLGQTAEEIANAPEFGAWAHRTDIESGESYVDRIRKKRRYIW